MDITLEEMQRRGLEAVETLNKLTGLEVPANLHDALAGEWMSIVQREGEGILGNIPAEELHHWGTRVITCEKANFFLGSFEVALNQHFVQEPTSPFRRAFARALSLPKFILSHLVELREIVWPIVAAGFGELFSIVSDSILVDAYETMKANGTLPPDPEGFNQTEYFRARYRIEAAGKALENLGVQIAVILGYYAVEELLALTASTEVLKEKLRPVANLRDFVQAKICKAALPQRPRVAVRRRKRAR